MTERHNDRDGRRARRKYGKKSSEIISSTPIKNERDGKQIGAVILTQIRSYFLSPCRRLQKGVRVIIFTCLLFHCVTISCDPYLLKSKSDLSVVIFGENIVILCGKFLRTLCIKPPYI